MKEQFPVGQVVGLKSGGVAMTVTDKIQNGLVECSWLDQTAQYTSRSIPTAALKVLTTDKDFQTHREVQKLQSEVQKLQLEGNLDQLKKQKMGISAPILAKA